MEVKLVDDVRITDDNVNEIEIEYVVAVAYASGGAMGEPGAVRLYTVKDWEMKCYYINPMQKTQDQMHQQIHFAYL